MSKVVVVGSINIDLVVEATRFPGPGETVPGTNFFRSPGGKGANQAVAAARAGAKVHFVGAIGDDPFGHGLKVGLATDGVDVSGIAVLSGEPTGTAVITLAGGENSIVVVPGANGAVTAGQGAGAPVEAGDVVAAVLEVPVPAIRAAFAAAREAGAATLLNAAPALPAGRDLFELTDTLVLNEHELALFADTEGTEEAGDRPEAELVDLCRGLGVPTVVLTLGRAGLLAVSGEEVVRLPAHRVEVVDTTGAGDCFVGSLAAERAAGRPLAEALRFANAAAALSVGRKGAAQSMPRRTAVEAMLAAG